LGSVSRERVRKRRLGLTGRESTQRRGLGLKNHAEQSKTVIVG